MGLELALYVTWALAAAGVAGYAATVAREVTYVTLADGRRQERTLPLSFKMLLPFVGNLDRFVRRAEFAKEVSKADEKLISGGYEGLITAPMRKIMRLQISPITIGQRTLRAMNS